MANEHATVVGGSSAARVLNCPGSVRLQLPQGPPGDAARRGTALHEAVAEVLINEDDPMDYVGFECQGYILDAEDVTEGLVPAIAIFDSYARSRGGLSFEVEQRVGYANLDGAWGTADIVGVHDDGTSTVVDFKFGYQPVTAEGNEQLMFYAAAAIETEGLEDFTEGDHFELAIIQPAQTGIDTWGCTRGQLVRFARELEAAVRVAEGEHAALRRGSWCTWCTAKATCPAWTDRVAEALSSGPSSLTPEQLGQFLMEADALAGWIKDIRALAKTQLESGHPVPGWKLVQRKTARQWGVDIEALVKLARRCKLGKRDIVTTTPLSPAQMEKLVGKERFTQVFGSVVHSEASGTSLAKESDKRPAVPGLAGLAQLQVTIEK